MKTRFLLPFVLLMGALVAPAATVYRVDVTLPAIAGAGFLDFQFNQANAGTSLPAVAEILNFQSAGFTFGALTDATPGVTGDLVNGILIPNDQGPANYFTQSVDVFGASFSFLLRFSGPAFQGGATDGGSFYLSLFDDTFTPIVGTLLFGELANVFVDGDGAAFVETSALNAGSVNFTPVPEPGFAPLLLGLSAALLWRRR